MVVADMEMQCENETIFSHRIELYCVALEFGGLTWIIRDVTAFASQHHWHKHRHSGWNHSSTDCRQNFR